MPGSKSNTVAVVGGGLVGSLLSIFLARRGWAVTVYERQSDIRQATESTGRSINLVATNRGLAALDAVDLKQEALDLTVPVYGRMMHSVDSELAYQPYGKDETECNYSISRLELNQYLLNSAEKHGSTLRFDKPLQDADLDRGRLFFEEEQVQAKIVVGADGAGSPVRSALTRREGYSESSELLGHGYKELLIPIPEGASIERNALHIWPRGDRMLMALPNLDGSFTVTLYLPNTGRLSFESLDSETKVREFFENQFPDAIPLIPGLEADYFANPTGILGTVRCEPWHLSDRALLIGDAAHAIVPFFGQGMNCGFEDCLILDRFLDRHGPDDLETVFERFSRSRKPDADAIADMALENFVEMSDRVGDPRFLLRKQVENLLELTLPKRFRSRYSMVMYSSIPYRVAFEAGQLQREILDRLCEGLSRPEDVDVTRAEQLIAERLTPFLDRNGVRLDY